MIAFLLAAQLASAHCTTIKPGPDWICRDGGWIPANQLPPPEPPTTPPPPGTQAPLVLQFQVGRTYKREATGVVIHIAALGAGKNGLAVYAAECQNEVVAEQCWYPGAGRFILANASASGWVLVP